jgi:hypothetical protein
MIQIKDFDENVKFFSQLNYAEYNGKIYLLFVFKVPTDVEQTFLTCWKNHGDVMGKFEGYGSEKLHKGISGSDVYFNYAIWNSLADFRIAFFSPDSQTCLGAYPDSCTFTGQIVKPIFVEGVCNAE